MDTKPAVPGKGLACNRRRLQYRGYL